MLKTNTGQLSLINTFYHAKGISELTRITKTHSRFNLAPKDGETENGGSCPSEVQGVHPSSPSGHLYYSMDAYRSQHFFIRQNVQIADREFRENYLCILTNKFCLTNC